MKVRTNRIAVLALVSILPQFVSSQQKRANLLFIMTDQQRSDALAIVGKYPFLATPNLNRLAGEGVFFEKAYTLCAVCAPARGTLFTGCSVKNHSSHYDGVLARQL